MAQRSPGAAGQPAGSAGGASFVVLAPFAGRVVATEDLPDPVFAQRMMGEGIALEPEAPVGAGIEVCAPITGRVTSQWHHAGIFAPPGAPEGTAVLVHLGLDTVTLEGEGFTSLRHRDSEVTAGVPVKTWDPAAARARGLSLATPIVLIATTKPYPEVDVLVTPRARVEVGQELFRVTTRTPR